MTLIPGRDCGDCALCCTLLNIDKPEIQKQSGARCLHCTGSGCAIYESRPPVCRAWYCGWRTVDIFDDSWRPDKTGVLAMVETEGIPENFELSTGISLMLAGNPNHIIRQKWFQEFVVTGVMNSVPLFLSLPGPRGYQAATVFLNNEQMLDAIKRGTVKDALEMALRILRGWAFEPAVITNSGNDVSS